MSSTINRRKQSGSSSVHNQQKKFDDYYLGLDIGTDSIGWCVTDPEYNILKFNGKAMWGIRLFDEAEPAASRRSFRTSRRRLKRKKQRVALVEELLNEEMMKVDPLFYLRLKESSFHLEDKQEIVRQPYALFSDTNYTDIDYHKEFPTIYHLRRALILHEKSYDIRLYYLAISHFMKHRGHFLFEGSVSDATSFEFVFSDLKDYACEQMEMILEAENPEEVKSVLLDRRMGKTEKKQKMKMLFNASSEKQIEALAALCGSSVSLDKLFSDPSLKDALVSKISFSDGIDEEKEEMLSSELGERFEYIIKLKAVYDWTVLTRILAGCSSISEAKIKIYEKHQKDLRDLKRVVHQFIPEAYKSIFSDSDVKDNYLAYSGHVSGKNQVLPQKRITEQKEFCDFVRKKLKVINAENADLDRILTEAEQYVFMPKQVSKSNAAIPYQVHLQDLWQIVTHMGEDYPALSVPGEDGLSVCDKIVKIFSFKIPYYVGPLNDYHKERGGNSWVIRKEQGRVLPWNFDEKVDRKASAEAFIERLTNKCTYLIGENVIPKDSLLYSRYLVLNELNNVKINGNRLSVPVKQRLYNGIFKKRSGKYSLKKLKSWLLKENIISEGDVLSGIDSVFQASLKSYQDFYRILGTRVDTDPGMVEDLIKDIVIFGDDRGLLRERICEKYDDKLTKEEIKAICRLSYSGWGRFSSQFLNGIEDLDPESGEAFTIIQFLWEGQENLMELLSSRHNYMTIIKMHNDSISGKSKEINYDLVHESYASPAVKRAIWQTLQIVKEIMNVTRKSPSRVFLEMAREKEDNPSRKASRKNKLLDVYKGIKSEKKDWIAEIGNREDREFNSKKLYLYYTQMGRDMYSGEPIDLHELLTTKEYDIDHIYPQSVTKDDSILNNLVLVRSSENRDKGDTYPIPAKYRQPELWTMLLNAANGKGLISKEKYDRLMRRYPLSEEELAGFISRQLVETRQSSKVVAQILSQTIPETKIVYSKAGAISDFRRDNGFLKSRAVNDYHHAKDAYLNIVVGNVYYTKFTDNPVRYLKEDVRKSGGREKYNLDRMFKHDIARNGKRAWIAGNDGTIQTVKKYMCKNNILFTRYATEKHGGFYDQQLMKKGSGDLYPIKTKDGRFDTGKYGGYNKPSINYYMLVESDGKKGRIRTLEGVPVYLHNAEKQQLDDYCSRKPGLNLKNPVIIIDKIRIGALLKINGYPMHISGKTGKMITMKNAVQLCISPEDETIVHRVEKVIERLKENKSYTIDDYDKLGPEDLKHIYDLLTEKSQNKIYSKRSASQTKILLNGAQQFRQLSLEDQCRSIYEILHLFQCKYLSADLRLIGGASQAGTFKVSSELTKNESALLINPSVTGLFETTVDLLKYKLSD